MKCIRVLIFLLLTVRLSAQVLFEENDFLLETKDHDFGMIEEGPIYEYAFTIRNISPDTIKNLDVRSGCGCVTASYPRVLLPGDRGKINVMFNSNGRIGVFNKNLVVRYRHQHDILMIKGIVYAHDTIRYSTDQLKNSARGQVEFSSYDFGEIRQGQKDSVRVKIYNNGKDTLRIIDGRAACNCISSKLYRISKNKSAVASDFIAPGKSGDLEIKYYPNSKKSVDVFTLVTNDRIEPLKAIRLTANVINP